MLVIIESDEQIFENNHTSVDLIIKWIESTINNSEKYFSHIVIDDHEVYEDFDLAISDDIEKIKEIEVILKTESQLLNDIYLSGESYLIRAIPELKVLSEKFYQNPEKSEWNQLELLFEGISWLDQLFEAIATSKNRPNNWDDFVEVFTNIRKELVNFEHAIEGNDQVLIADLITYEVIPLMEKLKVIFTICIDERGKREDVN